MEDLEYKNKNIDKKCLQNMRNNKFLIEKGVMKLKDKELKDREEKIKRDIEELFYKVINMSKDDMDKFEEQEMKKIRPIKKSWYNRLIKQTMVKENNPKIITYKLKDKIIRDIWTLFETEKHKRRKKHNERIINDRTIRDIRTLFE